MLICGAAFGVDVISDIGRKLYSETLKQCSFFRKSEVLDTRTSIDIKFLDIHGLLKSAVDENGIGPILALINWHEIAFFPKRP